MLARAGRLAVPKTGSGIGDRREGKGNARKTAERFAEDSESELGKIRTADQGQFSIENRDNNTPWLKNVRIVTTVVYYLKD